MHGVFTVACGGTWESWGAHLAEAPLWQGLTALVKKAVIVTMRTNCVWGTYGARDTDKQKQNFVYDQAGIFIFLFLCSFALISESKYLELDHAPSKKQKSFCIKKNNIHKSYFKNEGNKEISELSGLTRSVLFLCILKIGKIKLKWVQK